MSDSTNSRAADINGGKDEDEALRIAIALSLGQDPGQTKPVLKTQAKEQNAIDLTQIDDDETASGTDDDATESGSDVDSKDHSTKHSPTDAPSLVTAPRPSSIGAFHTTSSLSSIIGLDRKKMEEERLARLNKRKVSEVETSPRSAAAITRPAQRAKVESASLPERPAKSPQQVLPVVDTSPKVDFPFPRGVVKKTWASGQTRRGDDITIEEVLQKDQLQLAVLSSFVWDEEWLLTKIDITRTKMVLVAFAANEETKQEMRNNVPASRIRFCFPPMNGMGTMHSKLQLLKYDKYMRIVVPTGNFTTHDWGVGGTMENMVFIIDLPKFETAEQRAAQQLTPFGEDLLYFLRAQGLDEKLVGSLLNYNFSETSRYGFVHSIPGSFAKENDWRRIGYCGLGRAITALGLASENPIEFDYVCSSIGAVNMRLLASLYYACQGDPGLKELSSRPTGKVKTKEADDTLAAALKQHIRIYFPSRETVSRSRGGPDGAGTICFQERWWNADTFPQWALRDCKSNREGLVMHSKAIFVRQHGAPGKAFAYVGSANLSESAWGRLVNDRSVKGPKLTCRNWECGILIPVDPGTAGEDAQRSKEPPVTIFNNQVPVPMEVPGTQFAADAKGKKAPWFQNW
ncbi:hypothetical protein QBC38DRAFT_459054 [Podospora fimiseda]|uniref:PLD phosphodiesterase domain-containing protein n=1 Tax=Podospora fimiseda TaxID=252190 RepID=A0AAN7BHV8_9PEZI|nr:hypothetical protein QBC38DRAFT_459054 [Podospora fimiseda]